MTFFIIVYDVNVARVNKVKSILREYLFWVQNSVFEGELSDGKFLSLKHRLCRVIDKNEDNVVIYSFSSKKLVNKEVLGRTKMPVEGDVI